MSVRRFAILGHQLQHTMYPFIHKKLFALSGETGHYSVLDVPPVRMPRVVKNVLNLFYGYNVTIPYKQKIVPMLDELDGKAARCGFVNTVIMQNGRSKGYATDSDGLLAALRTADIPLKGRVVVLGSGDAARIMAFEAAMAGCETVLAVREERLERAADLEKYILALYPECRISVCTLSSIEGDFDLMMNATSVGMYPNNDAMPVDCKTLSRVKCLFDAVYNPLETQLMSAARAEGARVLGGMSMLVWQAALSHEIWDGAVFDTADIEALCEETAAEMQRLF